MSILIPGKLYKLKLPSMVFRGVKPGDNLSCPAMFIDRSNKIFGRDYYVLTFLIKQKTQIFYGAIYEKEDMEKEFIEIIL